MIAAMPRTASSVVSSARALAGTTSAISESGVTTRLRPLPPSTPATADRKSMQRTTLTRRTEDRTHSFERESPQEPTDAAGDRVPYVETIVTRGGRVCEEVTPPAALGASGRGGPPPGAGAFSGGGG